MTARRRLRPPTARSPSLWLNSSPSVSVIAAGHSAGGGGRHTPPASGRDVHRQGVIATHVDSAASDYLPQRRKLGDRYGDTFVIARPAVSRGVVAARCQRYSHRVGMSASDREQELCRRSMTTSSLAADRRGRSFPAAFW